MKAIRVVAGVIYNPARDQVLVAKRPDHLHQGGLWEFPGGKLEQGEIPQAALQRELLEELGIRIEPRSMQRVVQVSHSYPDKTVSLDFWEVSEFAGDPSGLEGQQIRWVPLVELSKYNFPKANQKVIEILSPG
jgi:8-oxo-dGTP diphosphatase